MSLFNRILLATTFVLGTLHASEADPPAPKPEREQAAPTESLAAPKDPTGRFPLPPEHFEFVEDSFKQVDEAMKLEWDSTEEILGVLGECTQDEIDKAAETSITYRDLYEQPRLYRGRVVSMSGVYHRVAEKFLSVQENWFLQHFRHARYAMAPANATWFSRAIFECGDHLLYPCRKVWFGQIAIKRQFIVNFISTEPLPKNLSVGDGARVAGVFLKRYAYHNSEDNGKGITWAPLVMVKSVNKAVLGGGPLPSDPVAEWIGAIASILAAIALFAYGYGRWKNKHSTAKYFGGTPPPTMFPGKSGKRLFGRR